MVLGAMCAYVLACFSFPGRRVIYYSMLAGLTFPIFMAIVPLFFVLKNIGLLNTLPGLIITYVAFALPFTVFFLYPFFRALPMELRCRGGRRRGGVAQVLPGDAADGQARHGLGGDLQLPRAVEPVPAARRPQHEEGQLRALAGHGVVRVPGGLQRRLRPPVRRRGHHRRAGARRVRDLPAPASRARCPKEPRSDARRPVDDEAHGPQRPHRPDPHRGAQADRRAPRGRGHRADGPGRRGPSLRGRAGRPCRGVAGIGHAVRAVHRARQPRRALRLALAEQVAPRRREPPSTSE